MGGRWMMACPAPVGSSIGRTYCVVGASTRRRAAAMRVRKVGRCRYEYYLVAEGLKAVSPSAGDPLAGGRDKKGVVLCSGCVHMIWMDGGVGEVVKYVQDMHLATLCACSLRTYQYPARPWMEDDGQTYYSDAHAVMASGRGFLPVALRRRLLAR